MSKGVDTAKLGELITEATEKLGIIRQKEVILLLGPSGVGKSTLTNYLYKKVKYSLNKRGKLEVTQINQNAKIAQIGKGLKSCTVTPNVFDENGLILVDTGGLFDNRGQTLENFLYICLALCLKFPRKIKALVLVIDESALNDPKGKILIDILNVLSEMFQGNQYKESLFLFVNKGFKDQCSYFDRMQQISENCTQILNQPQEQRGQQDSSNFLKLSNFTQSFLASKNIVKFDPLDEKRVDQILKRLTSCPGIPREQVGFASSCGPLISFLVGIGEKGLNLVNAIEKNTNEQDEAQQSIDSLKMKIQEKIKVAQSITGKINEQTYFQTKKQTQKKQLQSSCQKLLSQINDIKNNNKQLFQQTKQEKQNNILLLKSELLKKNQDLINLKSEQQRRKAETPTSEQLNRLIINKRSQESDIYRLQNQINSLNSLIIETQNKINQCQNNSNQKLISEKSYSENEKYGTVQRGVVKDLSESFRHNDNITISRVVQTGAQYCPLGSNGYFTSKSGGSNSTYYSVRYVGPSHSYGWANWKIYAYYKDTPEGISDIRRYNEYKQSRQSQIQQKNNQISSLSSSVSSLNSKISTETQTAINNKNAQLQSIAQNIANMETVISNHKQLVQKKEQDKEKLITKQDEIKSKEMMIKGQETEIQILNNQLQAIKNTLNEKEQTLKNYKAEIIDLQKERVKKQQKICQLNLERQDLMKQLENNEKNRTYEVLDLVYNYHVREKRPIKSVEEFFKKFSQIKLRSRTKQMIQKTMS